MTLFMEMSMGFKKTTRSLDFADLAFASCLKQNRSIKLSLLIDVCRISLSGSNFLPLAPSVFFSWRLLGV
jgi:hypothetical protein